MKKHLRIYIQAFICAILFFTACEEDPDLYKKKFTSESALLISEYLANNENTTMMIELIRIDGKEGLLNSYGDYTVFAPSDSAFISYLSSMGKSRISELDSGEVDALIDFHIILNEIDVKAKVTGVMGEADTTISGLRHFIDLTKGFNNILVNKESKIISIEEPYNGMVYLLDKVLEPHPVNIYDYLASNDDYSIFTSAIDACGLKDTLQTLRYDDPLSDIYGVVIMPYYTVFAEPDEVFNANGINSVEDLKNSVWNTNPGNAASADEALTDFVEYHLVSGQRTSYSFYNEENLTTLSMQKSGVIHIDAITDNLNPNPVINSNFGSIGLNNINSDISCINGLIHQLKDGILFINTDHIQTTIVKECEDGIRSVNTKDGWTFHSDEIVIGGKSSINIDFFGRFNENQQFYALPGAETGVALQFEPFDNGDWIEFKIRNVVPGDYMVKINYYRDETSSSENINIYFRSEEEDFSWETQLFMAAFDMAQQGLDDAPPQYRQDRELGPVTIEEYGNYIFRFAHVDSKYGIYDNIIMVPISE